MGAIRACADCGQPVTGHGGAKRCRPCGVRHGYFKKHGKPAEMLTMKCEACGKEWVDYASNKRSTWALKAKRHFCSTECRVHWTTVHNSVRLGGDGRKRSKSDKDKMAYRRNPEPSRQNARRRYNDKRDEILAQKKAADRALKAEVVAAYGGRCACCGESHIEFMTIDHVNGDGAEHRARCGKGRKVYADIKSQGFPKGKYQCLCLNCNIALGFYGYCPHRPELKRQMNKKPHKPGRRRTVR